MKLTLLQREWLQWVDDACGVTGVTDRRIANRMRDLGLVKFDPVQDLWQVTEGGRAEASRIILTAGSKP